MLTIAEVARSVDRDPETVRRWIRAGRLRATRVNGRLMVLESDLRPILDEIYPMEGLPGEWATFPDGTPIPNVVAAVHRSRSGR